MNCGGAEVFSQASQTLSRERVWVNLIDQLISPKFLISDGLNRQVLLYWIPSEIRNGARLKSQSPAPRRTELAQAPKVVGCASGVRTKLVTRLIRPARLQRPVSRMSFTFYLL